MSMHDSACICACALSTADTVLYSLAIYLPSQDRMAQYKQPWNMDTNKLATINSVSILNVKHTNTYVIGASYRFDSMTKRHALKFYVRHNNLCSQPLGLEVRLSTIILVHSYTIVQKPLSDWDLRTGCQIIFDAEWGVLGLCIAA